MYTNEKRVIHDLELLQKSDIALQLFNKDILLLGPKFEMVIPA